MVEGCLTRGTRPFTPPQVGWGGADRQEALAMQQRRWLATQFEPQLPQPPSRLSLGLTCLELEKVILGMSRGVQRQSTVYKGQKCWAGGAEVL